MIILGLLLLAAGAAAIVSMLWYADNVVSVQAFDHSFGSHEAGVVFAVGAIAGFAVALGIAMCMSGMSRAARKRSEMRRLRKTRAQEDRTLRQRNLELERELAQERSGSTASVQTSTGLLPTTDDDTTTDSGGRHLDLTDQDQHYADRR